MEITAIILLASLGLLVELEHRKAQRRRLGDEALSAALRYLAHSEPAREEPPSPRAR